MVPGKDLEDHFGVVEVGDTDFIEGTVYDFIYNLWFMNENSYVMKMMDTPGRLLADYTCKESFRIQKKNG